MSLVSLSGDPNIDGLLWGVKWDSASLIFGFGASTSQYSGYQAGSIANFQAFNGVQKAAVVDTMAQLRGLTNLNLVFNSDGSLANLRYGEASFVSQYVDPNTFLPIPGQITTAVSTPPDPFFAPTFAYGDMFFNSTDYNSPQKGNFAYATILHETGHSLGLKHGHSAQTYPDGSFVIAALPANRDGMEFSVMTYRSQVGGPTDFYHNETFGFAQTYMMNDIAALQYLYGADYTFHATATSYTWNPNTGEMFVNGVGQGTPGANRIFLTIWDGGGIDTYDFSNYGTDLKVNLAPGNWSLLAHSQLAMLNTDTGALARANVFNALLFAGDQRSLIENATGGTGKDDLRGNSVANLLIGNDNADKLFGLAGNDSLVGGNGADRLDGGTGNDVLNGGGGGDILIGAVGNDRLLGASGGDAMAGGLGNDVFVYNAPTDGNDGIVDFSSSAAGDNDRFEFSGAGFGGLAAGRLTAAQFQSNTSAVSNLAGVGFLFETDTWTLRFDSDGSGGTAAMIIATLQAGAQVLLNDILII